MKVTLFPIDIEVGSLAILSRPRGFDGLPDDVAALKKQGVDIVVSALTSTEMVELGLELEEEECSRHGIKFISHPIRDRQVPDRNSTMDDLVEKLTTKIDSGLSIVIHCRAGIGRSGLIAAGVLIANGFEVDQAIDTISRSRGCRIPDTPEQVEWLTRFKDRWLRRLDSQHRSK